MKRKLFALLIALCLLLSACSAAPAKEEATTPTEYQRAYTPITRIDHCVLEPDDRERLSEKDMLAFRSLTESMLARRDEITVTPETVSVNVLLDLLRESPYYYFLREAKIDGNTVRFTYAYSPEKQQQMLSFIDEQMLRIANHEASESDNTLDVILKIYLAVTHEMTYDNKRTDNKELGSPLFVYPADEIYKALRDKKSLCYGFAYVLRFALLQRGIDCFCVYGLCNAHNDGHEWIIFRYDDTWFHCDPAWDRVSEDYAKLIHFGKTDDERKADTLDMEDFSSYHESTYSDVKCTDDRFSILRGIVRFTYVNDHRFYMTDRDGKEYFFDTGSFSFVD